MSRSPKDMSTSELVGGVSATLVFGFLRVYGLRKAAKRGDLPAVVRYGVLMVVTTLDREGGRRRKAMAQELGRRLEKMHEARASKKPEPKFPTNADLEALLRLMKNAPKMPKQADGA